LFFRVPSHDVVAHIATRNGRRLATRLQHVREWRRSTSKTIVTRTTTDDRAKQAGHASRIELREIAQARGAISTSSRGAFRMPHALEFLPTGIFRKCRHAIAITLFGTENAKGAP